jgi:hypothetical protein
MPTGLKDSPLGPVAALVSSQPRRAVNNTINTVIAQTGVPQVLPAVIVPAGLSVALRGSTAAGVNAGVVRVALYPDVLLSGGGRVITPDTEISFPVDHLGQIWIIGTAADGLVVTISGVPIG